MLLSILIPTFNHDCSQLVRELAEQLTEEMEIIVGDDGSTDTACQERLAKINMIPHCRLWTAAQNLGRSAIRNRLATMAKGEWLLFIDSDAGVANKQFLEQYLENRTEADVVVGGTRSPEKCPSPEVSLRYNYERSYWAKATAEKRNRHPHDSFTAFNFMIRREVMMETMFDENCSSYGHEDTLLGKALEAKGRTIIHIENPLIHLGLDTNEEFMQKTEQALAALHQQTQTLDVNTTLLKMYRKLEKIHLLPILRLWHTVFATWERKKLTGKRPNLTLFNIYKLGYFASLSDDK